ncbi:MAG TPA: hypothetical protein VFH55_13705 [Nitrospiria bacterium]|nr:hypothetical protein [Nitrospiria bacterium]
MAPEDDSEADVDVNLDSMSPEGLVDLIQQLEGSRHIGLRKRAQKELVGRLKKQGFTDQRIAVLLTTNVYGVAKKKTIAKEWADALGITLNEFLKLIGK